ncbi:M23 family metallopeptidase [Arthrobacter sp. UC242_113]|uniref:M23 family metallopeptidase n=1 Tax=Arthrobacter sp. UC242_113 TaxID=3374550 RepID=UPI0037572679
MSKHLAPAAVRRTPQDLRHAVPGRPVLSRAVRIGAGAAFLAVYAFGFQGAGPVLSSGLSSGQVAADLRGDASANVPVGSVTLASAALASAAEGSVSGALAATGGAVSASADAYVSYSRTVVFTAAKPVRHKLHAASSKVQRPAAGTLMAPVEVLTPTSHFGLRTSPITGSAGEFHWGQDFAAACGTRVFAADSGVVRTVGWHPWGGGNRVEIDHGNGLITTYNHLEGIGVKKGQSVQVGQLIAKVGTTGSSTGCHLHFETILNGKHTDPDNWTLLRLRHSGPVANVKMTDYGKAGTATETPSWAVPVEASARRAASVEGHESPAVAVSVARSSSASAASVSAAQPSYWWAVAPAQWVASPKPVTPAPAPKVAAPKPKPAKPVPAPKVAAPKPKPAKPVPAPKVAAPKPKPAKPVPAPKVAAPKPKPVPAPVVVPKPKPVPAPVVAPKPATPAPAPVVVPAPVVAPAPAPVVVPAPVVTPAPAPVVVPAPVVAPAPARDVAPAPVEAPVPVITPAPAPVVAPVPVAVPAPVVEPAPAPVVAPVPVAVPAPVVAPEPVVAPVPAVVPAPVVVSAPAVAPAPAP